MKRVNNVDEKNNEEDQKSSVSSLATINILYEDEYLMVVNKPPGINVHP